MKNFGLLSIFTLCIIVLAGCTNKIQENIEPESFVEEIETVDAVVEPEEDDNEEVVQRNPDSQRWNLLAFNGAEVDGNYEMEITNNNEIFTKFCNSIGGNISFDGDDEGTISATLVQTEMACEGESMNLENAFKIDGATYSIMADEDGGSTMIIKTDAGDKFIWRKILE